MGLDVFASNKQGGSWTGPLWPHGVLVFGISPALGGPLFLPFSSGAHARAVGHPLRHERRRPRLGGTGAADQRQRVARHVVGAGDGHEYLRFDCFRDGPHYHYIEPSGEKQTIVDFDPAALGDMLPWALRQLRERLEPMLTYAGGEALVPDLDPQAIDRALLEVAKLAEEAEAALAARRR